MMVVGAAVPPLKIPVPLVWVATAVWSQFELLFCEASQKGAFGVWLYWSSL
ncbi:MAG: hypothetical protein NVS3B12_26710 [Acidimicrobiales bacterium]